MAEVADLQHRPVGRPVRWTWRERVYQVWRTDPAPSIVTDLAWLRDGRRPAVTA
jgi:hypothetical protein